MTCQWQPADHIKTLVLELVADALLTEGHSAETICTYSDLVEQWWRPCSLDIVLGEAKFILPESHFRELLSFCKTKYPLIAIAVRLP